MNLGSMQRALSGGAFSLALFASASTASCGEGWGENPRGPAHSSIVRDHAHHADSVVFGDPQHAASDSARRLASANPDRFLLERLLDEYAGLDFLADQLTGRRNVEIRGTAWRHNRGEHARIAELRQALADAFHQRYEMQPGRELRELAESIAALPSKSQQRQALDGVLVESHTRKLILIEAMYPRLRNSDVRAAIDRTRARLQEEVGKLAARAAH